MSRQSERAQKKEYTTVSSIRNETGPKTKESIPRSRSFSSVQLILNSPFSKKEGDLRREYRSYANQTRSIMTTASAVCIEIRNVTRTFEKKHNRKKIENERENEKEKRKK